MFHLNSRTAVLLILSQLMNIALVAEQLTFWMLTLITVCLVWRIQFIWFLKKQPQARHNRYIVILLAICGCIAIGIVGRQLGLLLAMLHLLCLSYGLKTLELNTRKDFYQLVILGFFIIAASLIFSQSLLFTSILALITIFNVGLLIHFFSPTEKVPSTLTISSKLLLQSLPLALVLFFVFPRLEPFWKVPLAKSAQTGLSDTVSPSDIADLARSNELAFRVTFESNKPTYSQLYWRALVLDEYTGRSWIRSKDKRIESWLSRQGNQLKNKQSTGNSFKPVVTGPAFSYQVIASPSYTRWLFGLDIAVLNPQYNFTLNSQLGNQSRVYQQADYTIQSKDKVTQALSYHLDSYYNAPLDLTISNIIKHRSLSYPKGSNPRLEQEAINLRQRFSNDQELAQTVLDNFREQSYFYTLKPPLLLNNSLDEFYFDTKTGFCEHYASAFTFLMRAAGIPARMVTGYMGGEYNPEAEYYAIYQYDAHAWSEIWLEGIGWQRVDPTSAVDPERVEQGFSAELALEQESLNNNVFSLHNYKTSPFINTLRLKLAAIDYQWTRWFIGYTSEKQMDLLSRLFGKMKPWKNGAIIGFSLLLIMLMLWLLQNRKKSVQKTSSWLSCYRKALNVLKKNGTDKPKSMTVTEFASVVSIHHPNITQHFDRLTDCYITLEYKNIAQQEESKLRSEMYKLLKLIKKNI